MDACGRDPGERRGPAAFRTSRDPERPIRTVARYQNSTLPLPNWRTLRAVRPSSCDRLSRNGSAWARKSGALPSPSTMTATNPR